MTDPESLVNDSARELAAVRVQLEAALPSSAPAFQASEHVGRILLECSPDCVQLLDGEGRVHFMNAGGLALLEMDDASQWRGKSWWDLWPASEAPTLREALRAAVLGKTSRFQAQSFTGNGKLKWWDVIVAPVPNEGAEPAPWRVAAVSRDITEQRIAEVTRGKLAAIVHSSIDGIVSKDLNGVITSWNEGAERIFGYSEAEALGQSIMMLLPVDRQDEEVNILRRIRRGEFIDSYDTRRRHRDGTIIDVSVTISPIRDSRGRIVGASKIARDISDRKLAEAALLDSEARVRLATEATGVGIWEWHVASNSFHWDPQLFQIYGMTPSADGSVDYQTWGATVEPEDLAATEAALRDVITQRDKRSLEFRIRRVSDGQLRHIHAVWSFRINEQARTQWVIGTNRDVTERRQMEKALTTADRRKDEFLATLAHELRNPLAPIRMGLEVLKHAESASASAESTRAMMERQVQQLVCLIDDLMDVSRISSGRLELYKAPVLLGAVLDIALESTRPLIEKSAHELTYQPSSEALMVNADLMRLAQVFVNLLNNACKYTPSGGRISVRVERQGDEALVSVRDTGVGIAPEALPYIFDMFTQIKGSSTQAQGGLGIGLSLVKQLVERHDGTVEGSSGGVGTGAEFVVRLKLCAPELANPAS